MRTLGKNGPTVSALGLGCMGMSDLYGPADRRESIATIHAALDAGITLIDTGDFYGMGHNEMLIAEALKGGAARPVLLSVKFGALRDPAGGWIGLRRAAAGGQELPRLLAAAARRRLHRHLPARRGSIRNVPIEDTVGAIAEMVKAGYVRHIGLSEVGADTLRRAPPCIRSATCRSNTR